LARASILCKIELKHGKVNKRSYSHGREIQMEFYHRRDLSREPFNLDLPDAKLWDLVRTGRLVPFIKKPLKAGSGPPHLFSGDTVHAPLFPEHIQKRYDRLHFLQTLVWDYERLSSKSDEGAWGNSAERRNLEDRGIDPASGAYAEAKGDFNQRRTEYLRGIEAELARNRPELKRLEERFAAPAEVYAGLDLTPFQHEEFLKELNDTCFRRDHIEYVLNEITAANQPPYSFYEDATGWVIGPRGRERPFPAEKGEKGYGYIHFILQYPGRSLSALKVYHLGKHHPAMAALEHTEAEAGMKPGAVKEARTAINSLKKKRDACDDPDETQRLTAEIDGFEQMLRSATRKVRSPELEAARINVQKGIKNARDKIIATFGESAPDLVHELNRISTGYDCFYASEAVWRFLL